MLKNDRSRPITICTRKHLSATRDKFAYLAGKSSGRFVGRLVPSLDANPRSYLDLCSKDHRRVPLYACVNAIYDKTHIRLYANDSRSYHCNRLVAQHLKHSNARRVAAARNLAFLPIIRAYLYNDYALPEHRADLRTTTHPLRAVFFYCTDLATSRGWGVA